MLRRRLAAAAAAAALVVGSIFVGSAAEAATGNKIVNSSNRCTTFIWEGTGYKVNICGLNNYAFNVRYIIVQRGTCLEIGFWSFTRYCAASYADRWVYIGSGTHFVR
jgi:hypothetical protein